MHILIISTHVRYNCTAADAALTPFAYLLLLLLLQAMLEAFVHDPLINWRLLNTTEAATEAALGRESQEAAAAAAAGGAPGAAGGVAVGGAAAGGGPGAVLSSTSGPQVGLRLCSLADIIIYGALAA
jgi:hypothetical protein